MTESYLFSSLVGHVFHLFGKFRIFFGAVINFRNSRILNYDAIILNKQKSVNSNNQKFNEKFEKLVDKLFEK